MFETFNTMKWKIENFILMLPTLKKLDKKYQYSMIYGLYIQCHNSKKLWLLIFFSFIRIGECTHDFERFYFEGL